MPSAYVPVSQFPRRSEDWQLTFSICLNCVASPTRASAEFRAQSQQVLTTEDLTQLIGTSIAVATLVRAVLGMIPLLDNDPLHRFAALRFGQEGWRSIRKLLLGGFLQGYVWAW